MRVTALDAWRRRFWHPTPQLEAFAGLRPMTVVTGGSEGIGLAIAEQFHDSGHDVMLVARDADKLALAARRLRSRKGGAVTVVDLDVASLEAPALLSDALRACHAYCDVLVNNAGIGLSGPLADQSPLMLARLIDLDVRAVTLLMQAFLPDMLVRGRGGILNVASMAGYVPGPYQAAYYASKSYVISVTRGVAHEVRGRGVRISVTAPGAVATSFHEKMGARTAHYAILSGMLSAESVARSAVRGYFWGLVVTVPGLGYKGLSLLVGCVPHAVLTPLMGWLLRNRG